MSRRMWFVSLIVMAFGLWGCTDDGDESAERRRDEPATSTTVDAGLAAVQVYFDDLEDTGDSGFFGTNRDALDYVQQKCSTPDSFNPDAAPNEQNVATVAKQHCGDRALMTFDPDRLRTQTDLEAEPVE